MVKGKDTFFFSFSIGLLDWVLFVDFISGILGSLSYLSRHMSLSLSFSRPSLSFPKIHEFLA